LRKLANLTAMMMTGKPTSCTGRVKGGSTGVTSPDDSTWGAASSRAAEQAGAAASSNRRGLMFSLLRSETDCRLLAATCREQRKSSLALGPPRRAHLSTQNAMLCIQILWLLARAASKAGDESRQRRIIARRNLMCTLIQLLRNQMRDWGILRLLSAIIILYYVLL
jgi:hypothetical protein